MERRARELGLTKEELIQKRQARRERMARRRAKQPQAVTQSRTQLTKAQETLRGIYAEEYTTFDALRKAMLNNGIVEHRVSPYDVIQRAIDDCATDYLLMRQQIERDSGGNIKKATEHDLYYDMERIREAMVRFSTFAMQYDIQMRQLKLSEARVAILATTLRTVLTNLGVNQEVIRQVPKMLIEQLVSEQQRGNNRSSRLDGDKATALAEILANDTEVVIQYDDVEEVA